MTKVLLTGFEPFDNEPINPSWEMIKALDNQTLENDDDTVIVTRCLPCVFGASITALEAAINEVKPDIVISFGQAGGRAAITPERVAINIDDARILDNAGNQPIDLPVIDNAPAAYFTTLPIKAMVQALQSHGIPALVSNSAGTFVCNHSFFALQHLARRYNIAKSGFVHIPYLPEQIAHQPTQPSMALQMLKDAVNIMIHTVVTIQSDSKIGGGAIH